MHLYAPCARGAIVRGDRGAVKPEISPTKRMPLWFAAVDA